jgi:hypothetical protein
MTRGQSLIVWAIAEAERLRGIDEYLMGERFPSPL